MANKKVVSLTGAPIVQLKEWVDSKNDPAFLALWQRHFDATLQGLPGLGGVPEMDAFYAQFLIETNQTTIDE